MQELVKLLDTFSKINKCILPKHRNGNIFNKTGSVYFITDGRYIKIGFAVSVLDRIKTLQTGSSKKLYLIGAIKGTRKTEGEIHRLMKDYLVRSEWFIDDEYKNITNYALERSEKRYRDFGYVS